MLRRMHEQSGSLCLLVSARYDRTVFNCVSAEADRQANLGKALSAAQLSLAIVRVAVLVGDELSSNIWKTMWWGRGRYSC